MKNENWDSTSTEEYEGRDKHLYDYDPDLWREDWENRE